MLLFIYKTVLSRTQFQNQSLQISRDEQVVL